MIKMQQETLHYKRKIMLIGNPSVGKTSLVRRFVTDSFSDKYLTTVGFKVMKKELILNGSNGNIISLNLIIWDMMGQMECRLMPPTAYQNAQGTVVVCDITRKETFDNLHHLINSLYAISPKIPIIVVANKYDLEDQRQFEKSELAEVSKSYGSPYLVTSAKTGLNVEQVFKIIGSTILYNQGIMT